MGVLHHITDVGLHHAFPEDWGLRTSSRLYAAMQEAISQRIYDVTDYIKEVEGEELLRIELQEYAYWIITTGWELQEEFGHKSSEWKVRTCPELMDKNPLGFELFMETVLNTLMPPSRESMRA